MHVKYAVCARGISGNIREPSQASNLIQLILFISYFFHVFDHGSYSARTIRKRGMIVKVSGGINGEMAFKLILYPQHTEHRWILLRSNDSGTTILRRISGVIEATP